MSGLRKTISTGVTIEFNPGDISCVPSKLAEAIVAITIAIRDNTVLDRFIVACLLGERGSI